jgi:hypothetical protein
LDLRDRGDVFVAPPKFSKPSVGFQFFFDFTVVPLPAGFPLLQIAAPCPVHGYGVGGRCGVGGFFLRENFSFVFGNWHLLQMLKAFVRLYDLVVVLAEP